MKSRIAVNTVIPPLTVAVAVTLVLLTVLSSEPGSGQAASGDGNAEASGVAEPAATPEAPPVPPTELVPVRQAEPASPPVPGYGVALRPLVIATDADDPVKEAWTSVLDGIGTPYDVLHAADRDLEPEDLVRPDGVGRYNAILLTSSGLLVEDDGVYSSALSWSEWETLWEYERTFGIRQVALTAAPGEFPEDYCLRADGEEMVEDESTSMTLTGEGHEIFDYLREGAEIPLVRSYVYRAVPAEDCEATPLFVDGSHRLGVVSTTEDGRERAALSMSLGPGELSTELLGYGLVRWATKGVFVGEQRHWINVDIDDWFGATLRLHADGTEGMIRLTGPEVPMISEQQKKIRAEHQLAEEFVLNLPYNAGRFDTTSPATCSEDDTPDPLSSYTMCLADEFRWLNHTMNHPEMNRTDYAQSLLEIKDNLAAAAAGGLAVPATVLKTPEYSGLGVYTPDPDSLDTPTDHGLEGSNAEMLRAASDAGVRYVHGNMSFDSHRPGCFNCGIYHPLQPDLLVVPDWPTNVAFEAATPDEQTRLYNLLYGENGSSEYNLGHDADYDEIIDREADVALNHIASGSAYAHTLHQGNLHIYSPGKSLTFDWLDALFDKYDSLYSVPLKTPDWQSLARYVEDRNSHFAELDAKSDAVWNTVTNEVIYTPGADSSVFFTGLETRPATAAEQDGADAAERYGSDWIAKVGMTTGETVTLKARPLS